MEVRASLNQYRQSPRKVRLVAEVIRGKKVADALVLMRVAVKRASSPLEKLIRSAVSNAKNNHSLEESKLYVKNITVNEGPTLKRFMPRAFGMAKRINKRTSHIELTLATKEAGGAKKK